MRICVMLHPSMKLQRSEYTLEEKGTFYDKGNRAIIDILFLF